MDSHNIEAYFRQHRRLLAVLLLVTCMAAVSGVFVGMRHTMTSATRSAPNTHEPVAHDDQQGFLPAPKYNSIPKTKWLANENWKFTIDQLPQAQDLREPQNAMTGREVLEALKGRSERRAFDGAPPTVPHEINMISSKSCVVCHGQESTPLIGKTRPATMSHPYFANCTQCHVPADGLRQLTEDERLLVASEFEGNDRHGPGGRAYPGAPPTTPHPVFMRQNCISCHGPSRPNAIRSSHPQRQNCLQCHAQNADYDNRERALESSPPLEP